MDLGRDLIERLGTTGPVELPGAALLAIAVGAAICVGWPPAWAVLRLVVTLVHELGHAAVGVAAGRRFTGFVLRADMSGHAVTVGRPDGIGLALTTWAGYPAPALLAAAVVTAATRGWAGATLAVFAVLLLLALPFVRSALTGVIVIASLGASAATWWWGSPVIHVGLLIALAVTLLVGAWRHLAATSLAPGRGSDAAVLASHTGVPRVVWLASFAIVCAGATWWVVRDLLGVLGPLLG